MSSDWTDHKNNNKQSIAGTVGGSTQTGGNGGSSVPSDF